MKRFVSCYFVKTISGFTVYVSACKKTALALFECKENGIECKLTALESILSSVVKKYSSVNFAQHSTRYLCDRICLNSEVIFLLQTPCYHPRSLSSAEVGENSSTSRNVVIKAEGFIT